MPHILTNIHDDINLQDINAKNFEFIAKNKFEDKICVNIDNKKFLLTKIIKNKKHLIKLDQATRVTPIYLAKQALKEYAKVCNSEILFSNIYHNENKLVAKEEFLKDISFFVNDFHTNKEICVEVGFGSGRHILHQAKKNPNTIYIGLEIHTPSIEQMLKQVRILNINNIYAVNYDARLFLEFLSSNSISQIFVHFPVPWDKKPHRRVISDEFVKQSLRALKNGGSLELRTDSQNYYEYSKELFKQFSNNKCKILKNQSLDISSKYEDRWKKMQKDIWDISIYSNENSKQRVLEDDFTFYIDKNLDFKKIQNSINKKPIVIEDYFIHFYQMYIVNNSLSLIALSMGSFSKPLSIYLILEKNKISYFSNNPIPTSTNYKAHVHINKFFNEVLV